MPTIFLREGKGADWVEEKITPQILMKYWEKYPILFYAIIAGLNFKPIIFWPSHSKDRQSKNGKLDNFGIQIQNKQKINGFMEQIYLNNFNI